MSSENESIKIPKEVLHEMKDRGAIVEQLGENSYHVSGIVYGDEAWKVYEAWLKTLQDEGH